MHSSQLHSLHSVLHIHTHSHTLSTSKQEMNSLTPHFKFPAPKLNNFTSTIPNSSTPFILSAIAAVQTPSSKISTKPTKINPLTPIESPTSSATPASTLPKKVLIPIGFGTEEMEAVILINVLRRAGAKVTVASVEHHLEVEASSGTKLIADTLISTCSNETFDLIALPGGMPGSVRLRDSTILKSITCKHVEEKRLYGAICAAPAITLLPWGLLKRKPSTCHPAFIDKISPFLAVKSNIQVSGELTTSRGPGTSFQFAISLVEQLFCESVAKEIGESLLMNGADVNSRSKEFNEIKWSFDHLPQVLIPIANGSEEIEFVTIVDILRRAKVNVLIASVERSVQIVASRGTKIKADKSIKEASESIYDLIILPGGSNGTERLNKSRILKKMLKEQELAGRLLGAICSSPEILQRQGLLKDKKVTAHPIVVNKLKNVVDDANVVIDSNLITSTGLSTATDFALAIVRKFFGHARARSVAEGLVVDYPRS